MTAQRRWISPPTPGPRVADEIVHHRDAGAIDFVKPKIQIRAHRPPRPGGIAPHRAPSHDCGSRRHLKSPTAPHVAGAHTCGKHPMRIARCPTGNRCVAPKIAGLERAMRIAPPITGHCFANNGKVSAVSFKKNCMRVLLQCGSSFLHLKTAAGNVRGAISSRHFQAAFQAKVAESQDLLAK